MMNPSRKSLGFTLPELMLVIFLIGVLAMTSFAVVQDGDDQQRFDATKTFYQLIKKAIVGDPTLSLNGETDVSGFVADMGRLPNCLRELLDISGCDPSSVSDDLPSWTQDDNSQLWAGWRGPYLQGMPESGGVTFRDGWKNVGASTTSSSNNPDSANYGWLFGTGATTGKCAATKVTQSERNTLYLQSCGSDAAVGGSGYAMDYPSYSIDDDNDTATANVLTVPPLVVEADYSVPLGEAWNSIGVTFFSDSGAAVIPKESLRLRVNYPENGQVLATWENTAAASAVRDKAIFLSKRFPATALRVPSSSGAVSVNATTTIRLSVPATLTTTGTDRSGTLTINNDVVITITDSKDTALNPIISLVDCPCVIALSGILSTPVDGLVLKDTAITFTDSGSMTVPVNQVETPFATGLLKPYIVVPNDSTMDSTTQITLPNKAELTFAQPYIDDYFPIIVLDSSNRTVTVSEAFTRSNHTIKTTTSHDTFTVTDGTTATNNVLTVAARSWVPMGQRTITIVCELTGKRFDGDCTNDTTTAGYAPVATPYSFTVKPRATLSPPSVIRWQIN